MHVWYARKNMSATIVKTIDVPGEELCQLSGRIVQKTTGLSATRQHAVIAADEAKALNDAYSSSLIFLHTTEKSSNGMAYFYKLFSEEVRSAKRAGLCGANRSASP